MFNNISTSQTIIMAQVRNGILSDFKGRIGPVTGYVRNGVNIIRTSKNRVTDKKTILRLAQREKIKVCMAFLKAFTGTGFLGKTFPAYGHTGTGYNRAMGCLMNQSVTGTYPDTVLSYPHVLVAKGLLPPAQDAAAMSDRTGIIHFNWQDNSYTGTAKPVDRAVLVAYFPSIQEAVFSLDAGCRKEGVAVLSTGYLTGEAETWMAFLSPGGEEASDSVYCGMVSC